MFDLGAPFGIYLIFCAVWVAGYFLWALLHEHGGSNDQ